MEDIDFRLDIAVVGLGLIGGSYAMALKELKLGKVYGIDVDNKTLEKALKSGAIDEASQYGQGILQKSDIVIIALYPKNTVQFVSENLRNFKVGAIITDTCGIKQHIIDSINNMLPKGIEFVAGHPMAGNEFKGFDAASKDIFIDANYIITPHERNSERAIRTIEQLAVAIGSRNPIRVSAKEHDNIISFTSGLPHIIAVSMMNMDIWGKGIDSFIGRSIKDDIRVAALNKELWTQIFNMNSENLIRQIDEMEIMLANLKKVIKQQDNPALERIFDNAIKRKKEIA